MGLSAAAIELLASPALAHYVTINPDGSPQVSVVWVGLDGGEIVSAHLDVNQRKVQNIRRDPRVALTIAGTQLNSHGLMEHLIVHGNARITEGGAPELLQTLAHTYLGPDVRFPPFDNPPSGVISRVRIERIAGVGPWVDEPGV